MKLNSELHQRDPQSPLPSPNQVTPPWRILYKEANSLYRQRHTLGLNMLASQEFPECGESSSLKL